MRLTLQPPRCSPNAPIRCCSNCQLSFAWCPRDAHVVCGPAQNTSTQLLFDLYWSQYPAAVPRFSGYDVVAGNGGVWFYVPPMITFFVVLTEVRAAELLCAHRTGFLLLCCCHGIVSCPPLIRLLLCV